jgi:hypothetical protein
MNKTFRSFTKASWNKFAVASSAFCVGTHTTSTGYNTTLHRGGFTSLGGGGFTSSGGGGGTSSSSVGRGGGTSSLPRFLDGSLDDAMCTLEEEEALGFTSWCLDTVVLGFSWCRG